MLTPTTSPDLDPVFVNRVDAASLATLTREYEAEHTAWQRIWRDAEAGTCTVSPLVEDFRDFLRAFGPKPHPHWSLDRLDNADAEYGPGKAAWRSPQAQANNRSNTRMLVGPGGEERPLTEWARRFKQRPDNIRKRLDRDWSPVEAITGRRSRGEATAPVPATGTPASLQPDHMPSAAGTGPATAPAIRPLRVAANPVQVPTPAGQRSRPDSTTDFHLGARGWPPGLPETPTWTQAWRNFAAVIGGPDDVTRSMFLIWVLYPTYRRLGDLRDRAIDREMPDLRDPRAPARPPGELAAWDAAWPYGHDYQWMTAAILWAKATKRGKPVQRPELEKALHLCRLTSATLVIATISRLSRDPHFLLGLEASGVEFVAVDMPAANRVTVGIMALVAEEECRLTSKRTKDALARAKARGVELGGYRGGKKADGALGTAALQARADAFVQNLAPILREMRDGGCSLSLMAQQLMERGIRTARGGDKWTAQAVKNALARLAD